MLDEARKLATSSRQESLDDYNLADCYGRQNGRIFLIGSQALTRILIEQARRDRVAGLNAGGFVSGYRGSPIGALDMELERAKSQLGNHHIKFLPVVVNEEMAATVMLGAQQAETHANADVDGAFGMWYGKGPGVGRSGNAYVLSPRGGVSSSMPHQSDTALMAWFIRVLSPATIAEYLTFGECGYVLSRYSGTWVGFKVISETVETAQSVGLPKGSSVLDFTGFSQKFGPVLSFIRIAESPDAINQVRIDAGRTDAVIACDAVVSASRKASICYRSGTRVELNLAKVPTGDVVLNRGAVLSIERRKAVIETVIMLGFAWQQAMIPVSSEAFMRAIELNGVTTKAKAKSFALGLSLAQHPDRLQLAPCVPVASEASADDLIARRVTFLTAYQDAAWASRYCDTLAALRTNGTGEVQLMAAAKSLFRLMSYKDEYEVARLHVKPEFIQGLHRDLIPWFEGILARYPGDADHAEQQRWNRILQAPMDIRGYGPVKETAAAKVQAEVAQLLELSE